MNVILWIILIGCAISGAIIGFNIEEEFADLFWGLLVGALIGLIIDVLFGGIVANFLIMVDNIEKIARSQKQLLKESNRSQQQSNEEDKAQEQSDKKSRGAIAKPHVWRTRSLGKLNDTIDDEEV
jgi:predicted lipid-binding transport protein (Tim44 family)